MLEPMQIDLSRFQKLIRAEKERCKRKGLCPYCREKGHDLGNYYHKPSALKSYKFRFILINLKSEEFEDLESNQVLP